MNIQSHPSTYEGDEVCLCEKCLEICEGTLEKCLRASFEYVSCYLPMFSDAEVRHGDCGPLERGDFQGGTA